MICPYRRIGGARLSCPWKWRNDPSLETCAWAGVGAIHELPLPSNRRGTLVVPGHARRNIEHQETDPTSRSLRTEAYSCLRRCPVLCCFQQKKSRDDSEQPLGNAQPEANGSPWRPVPRTRGDRKSGTAARQQLPAQRQTLCENPIPAAQRLV